jgi:hypothetical protein
MVLNSARRILWVSKQGPIAVTFTGIKGVLKGITMKKILSASLVAAAALFATAPAQAGGIKIGVLKCRVDAGAGWIIGSSKDAECVFTGRNGRKEYYAGSIGKLGVDIGVTTDTRLGWIVFAPGKTKPGSLKGSYTGVGAEATVGLGIGANVLVGGFHKSINLQPISVQGQTGLNIAAGVESLHLHPAK